MQMYRWLGKAVLTGLLLLATPVYSQETEDYRLKERKAVAERLYTDVMEKVPSYQAEFARAKKKFEDVKAGTRPEDLTKKDLELARNLREYVERDASACLRKIAAMISTKKVIDEYPPFMRRPEILRDREYMGKNLSELYDIWIGQLDAAFDCASDGVVEFGEFSHELEQIDKRAKTKKRK